MVIKEENDFIGIMTEDLETFEKDTRQRPFRDRCLENKVKLLSLITLITLSLHDLWKGFYDEMDLPLIGNSMFACLIGLFVADFITGSAHLTFDHVMLDAVPTKSRPLLQWLAFGFQYHHAVPTSWNDGDFFYLAILRTGFIGLLPFTLMQLMASSFHLHLSWRIFFATCAFSCLFCQVPHAAAHGRWKKSRVSWMIRLLQRLKLFVDPKDHHEHHTYFDRNFAIFNGWSEPLLRILYNYASKEHIIAPEMKPEVQRKVYVLEKEHLVRPYLRMFPDCRT